MQVEKAQETEQLFEVRTSKHGVFSLIQKDEKVQIAIKNQIVSEHEFQSFTDAEKYISKKPYELILIASYLYNQHINEQLQYLQNNNIKN